MKKFTCNCLEEQFKSPDRVFVGLEGQLASVPCVYKPANKVSLRQIRLEANYCPMCGSRLEELK